MIFLIAAALIGAVAGLRAMTAPAAVSWAAWLGLVDLSQSWLAFLAHAWTPYVLTALALAELATDQSPSTPSRKTPPQFGTRVVAGALSGAALALPGGSFMAGVVAGAVGAVLGTLGGAAARARLAASFGKDRPAAFVEDAVAILAAAAVVTVLR